MKTPFLQSLKIAKNVGIAVFNIHYAQTDPYGNASQSYYTVMENEQVTTYIQSGLPPVYQVKTYTDKPSMYTFTSNCSDNSRVYLS